MDSATIFSEAIKIGFSNSREAVKRDLASLLSSWSNDSNSFLHRVEASLGGDPSALTLLNEIKALSQASPPPQFGPVLATETGAAERLALSVRLLDSLQTRRQVKDFIEKSTVNPLEIFDIAKQIQDYLDDTPPSKRLWVSEFTPVFLQKTLEDRSNLLQLTIAATGGNLPTEWEKVERWIAKWTVPQRKSPQQNPGGDGFFEPQHSGYQPAAIHPLTLRVLRQSFLNHLNEGGSQEEIQAFCQWLVDRVFDGDLLTDIKLESVFAAGSLILSLAKQQGVIVLEDSQLNVPATAVFWGELSERVLKTIVNNSQKIDVFLLSGKINKLKSAN